MIELERKLEQVRKELAAKAEELKHLKRRERELKKLIKSIGKVLGKTSQSDEIAGRNEAKIS